VVHLHGARTGGDNDGWPENGIAAGDRQLAEYPNDQPATALWYHDHAMAITHLNVLAGLAGMYLIRDDEEDSLHLPRGEREVPLILCDRNLDLDSEQHLTGQLLHKVVAVPLPTGVATVPFLGPYNLVNGVIWPHLPVSGRWYRFRLLNAANARTYRLELRDEDGAPVRAAMWQIGTDAGLLPKPVALDSLTLAPAERADVLIDFSAYRGRSLTMVNTAAPAQQDPEVIQFRVRHREEPDSFRLPRLLSPSFVRLSHDSVPTHAHRWVVLTPPNPHPEMWEMQEVDPGTVTVGSDGVIQVWTPDGAVHTLLRVARSFRDPTSFMVKRGSWEQWSFLNLSGLPHPMHIHLARFQAITRDRYDASTFDPAIGGSTAPIRFVEAATLDPNETGWKDVIRVTEGGAGGGELVSVLGRFDGASGRFVYHCHILEHEDEGMMRPFTVMPDEVMALDPTLGEGGHGHGHGGSATAPH
jgi:FtsP/CotA-like multicopper oxidase with cupredoxin domain